MHAARPAAGWLLPALAILFFCSGICGLIYQVLWLRLLGLTFGVTTHAASTVWASFMGGLAIGSFAAGRVADRVRQPLVWFGVTEILIGAAAATTPFALEWLQRGYVALYPSLPDSLPLLTFVRFLIAFAVLIVPTALMGATLPLVLKSSAFRAEGLGGRMGVLYGTNTLGAIVGTLAAGLYLIPSLGIRLTFFVAAVLNLLVGLAAIAAGRNPAVLSASPAGHARDPVSSATPAGMPVTAFTDRTRRVVLAVFALSGLTSLALEVVWFRVLTLFLRPTVYGFALMLATVLAGIAFGSYLATPILRRRWRWVAILATIQIGLSIAAIRSFNMLSTFPAVARSLEPALSHLMPAYLVFPLMGSLLAILPAALLMGLAFPIGLQIWTRAGVEANDQQFASRIGYFYALNVAGSIVGSVLAGFVLLPALGSRLSLLLLASAIFVSGLGLMAIAEMRRSSRLLASLAAAVLFALAVARADDPFDHFVSQRYPDHKILTKEEGVEATVVIHESQAGERVLSLNGNHQASTGAGMVATHRTIGHLPMLLHPGATEALVIGLGGGATAGAVSLHDGVNVEVVELAAAVARGARYLADANHDVLTRPNVTLRIDDGRNHMLLTRRKYDIVTADVILPVHAGSGNLYSAEYFRLIRQVLKPGGLVLQWVAGTDAEYKIIARTFLRVFPETTVWRDGTLLVGSIDPFRLRRADFDRKMRMPGRAAAFRSLGIETFDQLRDQYVAGAAELRAFVGPGPILTDDRPLVEYFLSLPRNRELDLRSLRGDVSRIVIDN